MNSQGKTTPSNTTIENLSRAIFTVNRHAKTATNPKFLYNLKRQAILKMLKEGKAKKLGLHFSENPKFSKQQSDVLVKCGEYLFHIPPCKHDFENLTHLGELDYSTRNPNYRMPLTHAKNLLQKYTGVKEESKQPPGKKKYSKPVFKKLGDSFF
ncbi:YkyB family protein [Falsibacillus pallidus]|uniref:YkyB-like protein n=1 Tax=Falsibacillus pallidus TaxID=493781 RepID=A0A370GWM2_9BACI|nr:YkyB family protein [Falsibacillus pallidus]RDI47650.1 YkyB-like protein [Falsibacillus pallidus]